MTAVFKGPFSSLVLYPKSSYSVLNVEKLQTLLKSSSYSIPSCLEKVTIDGSVLGLKGEDGILR
jgi:hypothetical protein